MAAAAEKRNYVRLPRDQRMREIETAAREVFSQHGFNDAPVSEIARRAGVSEGAIYKFYPNKRELLHTILAAWYRGMIADFRARLEGVEGTRARLRLVIWQHLRSIRANPDLCRLFYSEVRSAPDYHDSELHDINRDYTRVLVEIVRDGMAGGDIRADVSPALVRDMIFGGVEHRVSAYLAGHGELDHEAVAAELSDVLFSGIAAAPPEPRKLGVLLNRLESVADRLDTASRGNDA